ASGDGGDDVRVLDQAQGQTVLVRVLLDLALGRRLGAIVGDGGAADEHIGIGGQPLGGRGHLDGGFYIHALRAGRRGQADRAADQRDFGAQLHGGGGQGVAHLPRAVVGNVAHWVQRLAGRAGGDHHAQPAGGLFSR